MSEEEKKALKEVKHFNRLTRYWQQEEYEEKEIEKYISILLNLIGKQQKEMIDLKSNCMKLNKENQALYESINLEDNNMLSRMYQKQKQRIKELEQINEEHRKLNGKLREENIELKKRLKSILDYIED